MKQKIFVGFDIAQDKHFYQISTKENTILSKGLIKNNKTDAKKIVKKLESIAGKEEIIIGMEATNNYHICLQKYFVNNGYNVIVINPLKTSAYKKIDDYGNKTDPIDANGICQFLIDCKHKKIKQMKQKYLKLREMCRCGLKLQSDLTRTAIRLHSRLVVINPEFKTYFSKPFCKSALYVLENFPTPDDLAVADINKLQKELDNIANAFGKKDTAKRIIGLAENSFGVKKDIEGYLEYVKYHIEVYKFLKKKVMQIKREIRAECLKKYCKREIDIISSIKGIGTEVAAGILSELGSIDNFDKVSSVVRFAGLIALQNKSGKFEGKARMSKQGSKYLRAYLHMAVMGAKLHSATFAALNANKKMKFKDLDLSTKLVASAKLKGNLARRILETCFINLKKDRLFDESIAFNSVLLDPFIRETFASQFARQFAKSVTS